MESKYKVVRGCVNQDNKRLMKIGDIIYSMSAFEIGRHLAEGNIVPIPTDEIERAISAPPEVRKKRRYIRKAKNAD